ncbi:hypothetical protein MKX03_036754, partial [Papaver bracteatum]
ILRYRNSVLEERITELQTKLHESQVAQKDDLEETVMTKKKWSKEEGGTSRRASKEVATEFSSLGESTNLHDESVTVQQRAEKEQPKLVLLQTGGTLEPYQIKEGSETHSTSTDSYQTMTVNRLRALLKERGLMVKGKK